MNTKLILVEGIPGSGKTTFAKKIADYYKNQGISVNLYNEGDYHPADLSWQACLTEDILSEIINKYPQLEDQIKEHIHIEENHQILSYAKIKSDNRDFYKEMEAYEVYDSNVPKAVFMQAHMDRWQRFGQNAVKEEALSVFECVFFQNHVNQLLNIYMADMAQMKDYFSRLAEGVKELNPVIVYLSPPDVGETIQRVAQQRVSPHGKWIDSIIDYMESTPYALKNNLKGFEGLVYALEERKLAEFELMQYLGIKTLIIEEDAHWDLQWAMIQKGLAEVN